MESVSILYLSRAAYHVCPHEERHQVALRAIAARKSLARTCRDEVKRLSQYACFEL
jgi:hypothetical protein